MTEPDNIYELQALQHRCGSRLDAQVCEQAINEIRLAREADFYRNSRLRREQILKCRDESHERMMKGVKCNLV